MIAPLLVVAFFCAPPVLTFWLAYECRQQDDGLYWLKQDCRRLDVAVRNSYEDGSNVALLCLMRAHRHRQLWEAGGSMDERS